MSHKPVYSERPITTRALDRMDQAARSKPLPRSPEERKPNPVPASRTVRRRNLDRIPPARRKSLLAPVMHGQ